MSYPSLLKNFPSIRSPFLGSLSYLEFFLSTSSSLMGFSYLMEKISKYKFIHGSL